MNPETAEVIRVIPITNADGKMIDGGVRGLASCQMDKCYYNQEKMNLSVILLFTLDAKTLSTTYIGTAGDSLTYDLASRVKPEFDPFLQSLNQKNCCLTEKAEGNTDEKHPEVGDTLLYTIRAKIRCNMAFLRI